MVGDDYVDARTAQLGDRFPCACPAIASEDNGSVVLDRGANSRGAEIVTVLDSSRNKGNGLGAEFAQRAVHDRRRADTIHVVVAVNENGFTFSAGASKTIDGFGETTHREAIV